MIETVQIAKISASSIVVYNKILVVRPRSEWQFVNAINLRDQEFNGFMSPKTKCKVRKMLDAWITAIEMRRTYLKQGVFYRNSKITFVTLTLSGKQTHSDNDIKRKMLNRFLVEMRREKGINHYFWRAEPQENGNIHFHILIDKYIPWRIIRDKWNEIQGDNGYLTDFYKKFLHLDPNSTDIHGLEKIKSLAGYVVKYVCKTNSSRKIEGRIWGCSDSLRQLTCFETELTNEVKKYIDEVEKLDSSKVIVKDDFTLIFCNNEINLKKISPRLFYDFQNHYQTLFNDLYTGEGRQKIKEKIVLKKEEIRHSTQLAIMQVTHSTGAFVSSQLPIFATSNSYASR